MAAMLNFYDELRRRRRSVRQFARVLLRDLEVERDTDRGSESLIHQTCFLAFAFLAYERGVAATGCVDEHGVCRLSTRAMSFPWRHLVVAVADHPSDPRGLWPADFDLISRHPAVSELDVVVTDATHDAGFRERIELELPGIEEVKAQDVDPIPARSRPVLAGVRAGDEQNGLCRIDRDREEELRSVARMIRGRACAANYELTESVAVVFQRPLPYLYLAEQVMDDAGIPYQVFDALPLAAEPYAAALDLALEVAASGGSRQTIVALLRSPLLQFSTDDEHGVVGREDVSALDVMLAERRAADPSSYPDEVAAFLHASGRSAEGRQGALRAARAAAAIAGRLRQFREASPTSEQLGAIVGFLRRHQRGPAVTDVWRDRYLRARAAVLGILESLADASTRHDDRPRPPDALAAMIRAAIERQTFAAAGHGAGVSLVDASTARFGEFDHVHLVGLVETEWPDRPRRNIFYGAGLLKSLGWPQEPDQMRAQQAAFRDLLELPRRTVTLHAFTLDGDSAVAVSSLVDLARAMPAAAPESMPATLAFSDEVFSLEPPPVAPADPIVEGWLRLRMARAPLTDPRHCGFVGERSPQAYRVSRVDRYIDCPFKYFAETVLGLPEERDELSGISPLERGILVHSLFEQFYRDWHAAALGTISADSLAQALEKFAVIARRALARLPAPDRVLEEVRLLGSIVSRGLAERVFELEIDSGVRVDDRLLEIELRGPFRFPRLNGFDQRTIQIRGKADRVDVLADGSLRVIDYKLSKAPDPETSIQVAVYATAAQQTLESRDRRPHPVSDAMYLAFGDERSFVTRLADRPGADTAHALVARASAFTDAVERIEAGEFPPRPRRPLECQWCRYAGVCRKEYQRDNTVVDATELV
jgi:RecB family exonuclease